MKAKIDFCVVVFDVISFIQVSTGKMSVLLIVSCRIGSQTKIWELGDIFSENRFMSGKRGD